MKFEIGKTYDVSTQRKGRFVIKITNLDDTWATGIIVEGEAQAMLDYNRKSEGEEITIRRSFTRIIGEKK